MTQSEAPWGGADVKARLAHLKAEMDELDWRIQRAVQRRAQKRRGIAWWLRKLEHRQVAALVAASVVAVTMFTAGGYGALDEQESPSHQFFDGGYTTTDHRGQGL